MSKELKAIQQQLISLSAKSNHSHFEKMIPGSAKIYGVKTPDLNIIVQKYKAGSFTLAEELWNSGWLEERIIAIKIMEKTGKDDPKRLLKLFKQFSKSADNWAVCDGLGMQFLRGIVKSHSKEIFALAKKYSSSGNIWQRRLSLVMIERYTRAKGHRPEIKKIVEKLEGDDEYYVKKAVIWIKKNFEKGK